MSCTPLLVTLNCLTFNLQALQTRENSLRRTVSHKLIISSLASVLILTSHLHLDFPEMVSFLYDFELERVAHFSSPLIYFNFQQHSTFSEAENFSGRHEISRCLWKVLLCCSRQPTSSLCSDSDKPSPRPLILFQVHFNITLTLTPISSKWFSILSFPTETLYPLLFTHTCHSRPPLIHVDLITEIKFGEWYESWNLHYGTSLSYAQIFSSLTFSLDFIIVMIFG